MKKPPQSHKHNELRQYQLDAIACAVKALTPGSRNMLVMPTGSGKSVVIAAIARMFPGKQILIITPRVRLVQQMRPLLDDHGVLSSSIGSDLGHQDNLLIGTYQTIIISPGMVPPWLIIIDECHLVPPDSQYGALIARFPNAAVIGLTATPYRGTEKITECNIGWKQIYSISILDLIGQGRLVPPRSMATLAASFGKSDTSKKLFAVSRRIVKNLVQSVRKEKRKKCLVFCADIAHAIKVQQLLLREGEACVNLVHSMQSPEMQDEMFENFKNASDRTWLVNVSLVSIGIDIPNVDCIAILRDISSFAFLVQVIGRGLRPFLGKHDCLIYDFGTGTKRFGFVDDPQFASAKRGSAAVGPAMKTCPECSALMHISAVHCPRCSHLFNGVMSLSDTSKSTQLLTDDYLIAEYQGSCVSQDDRGLWLVEHQMTEGDRNLRAVVATATRPDKLNQSPEAGSRALVKRERGDLVVIVSWVDPLGLKAA